MINRNMNEKPEGPVSSTPTPWAVQCYRHGKVYLSHAEYVRQMSFADARWSCPLCSDPDNVAAWDDDNYEEREE